MKSFTITASVLFLLSLISCIPVGIKRMVRPHYQAIYKVRPYGQYMSRSDIGSTYVMYQTKEDLLGLSEEHRVHMLLSNYDKITEGGRIIVLIERGSPEMCNTSKFHFMIMDSEKETILSRRGSASKPFSNKEARPFYDMPLPFFIPKHNNYIAAEYLRLQAPIVDTITIAVTDSILNKEFKFDVMPSENIKK